jgi:hypothetical protein
MFPSRLAKLRLNHPERRGGVPVIFRPDFELTLEAGMTCFILLEVNGGAWACFFRYPLLVTFVDDIEKFDPITVGIDDTVLGDIQLRGDALSAAVRRIEDQATKPVE